MMTRLPTSWLQCRKAFAGHGRKLQSRSQVHERLIDTRVSSIAAPIYSLIAIFKRHYGIILDQHGMSGRTSEKFIVYDFIPSNMLNMSHCSLLYPWRVLLSDAISSHNTSEAQDVDDSISEVIDVLRGTILPDGKSTEFPKEYEDTDRSVHQGVPIVEIP